MNYFSYIIKFLYRIKWWLILCPMVVALLVYFQMGTIPRIYKATTTIYTGIVSGYDLESAEALRQDGGAVSNAMDNLISIILSQTTLKNVSMRLYAQDMTHGDPNKDNQYILSRNYRKELNHTPESVRKLIDRNNEEQTLENLHNMERASHDNHIYGLFHWTHRYYSFEALSKIQIKRIASSDMLEISYENDDPGVVYNTLMLLNEEFVKEYKELRFGETNNVIKYFEAELARVGGELRGLEDSLRDYNVSHRIINYDEQTKHIAALDRDFELNYADIMRNKRSSEVLSSSLESQLEELKLFKNNADFVQRLHNISDLHAKITTANAFRTDESARIDSENVNSLKQQLDIETQALKQVTAKISSQQFTKEGVSSSSLIQQWLDAVQLLIKSNAELGVITDRREVLDKQYSRLSPVGATLKRTNRSIGFSEESYLSLLQALNAARLRQKNLQMSSATLRITNPPVMPISAEPSKRKLIVLASAFCTFFFILSCFIILELLDRTLRDRLRTERITGSKVLGAFPAEGRFGQRSYTKTYRELAAKQIADAALNYFQPNAPHIINLLSTEVSIGKSFLSEFLADYLRKTGMSVRLVSWNADFDPGLRQYILATKLQDFIFDKAGDTPLDQADVVIVEYPAFATASVPASLLRSATLNILVTSAIRTWKETDQLLLEKAKMLAGTTPIVLCLNNAQRGVVESFTGLLPPFTRARMMNYRLGQFGFTATK